MNFEQFHVLGETIRSELFLANNDEQKLPQIAACALSRADLETDLDLNAIGEFLRTTPVRQQPQTDFSDLPLVFYRCDAFHVEMLIWTGSSTTIHQHSFSGAFRVFARSSLHSEYEFEKRQRISSRLLLGRTRFKNIELLRQGDVRQIVSGRGGLLHGLFHLDSPSVTLVVRNSIEPWAKPQYSILRPSIAYAHQELEMDPRVVLISRLLKMVGKLDRSQAVYILIEQVPVLDFARLFMLLMRNYELLNRRENWQKVLGRACERHGELADNLIEVLHTAKRESSVASARGVVVDSDLRFFLALLLNGLSRAQIQRLLSDRFPEQDPDSLCVHWLAQLSKFGNESKQNAIFNLQERAGLARYRFPSRLAAALPFDPEDFRTEALLMTLLDGLDEEQMMARLMGKFSSQEIEASRTQLLESHAKLKELSELQPLLSRSV